MYVIKRSENIKETLCLENKDGTIAAKIDVVVDVDTISADYIKKQDTLIAAQKAMKMAQKSGNNAGFKHSYELYAAAIVDFMGVVFGKENTCKILEFYDNRYVEMLMQVIPFIKEKFTPAIYRSVGERKKQLKNLRKRSFR